MGKYVNAKSLHHLYFLYSPATCKNLALGASIGAGDDCAASVGLNSVLHPIVFTVLELL